MTLKVPGHSEILRFFITDLGGTEVILGLPWLRKHNPSVNWEEGEVLLRTGEVLEEDSEDKYPSSFTEINASRRLWRHWLKKGRIEDATDEVHIAAGYTYSQAIATPTASAKAELLFKELVPPQYRHYAKVFSEEELERLPTHKPY